MIIRTYIPSILFALVTLSSCSDDDDVPTVFGSYEVSETNHYDAVDTYPIDLTQAKSGGVNIEIKNFGGFMFVPVKGTLDATALTIPTQTFTAGNEIIKISGSGILSGKKLDFTYTMESDGDLYEYSCAAIKK